MTREAEIYDAFDDTSIDGLGAAEIFAKGAKWADSHPYWISVDDDEPILGQEVLAFIDSNNGKFDRQILSMHEVEDSDGISRTCAWGHYVSNVTHWMPLPKAPSKVIENIECDDDGALTKFLDSDTLKDIVGRIEHREEYDKICIINKKKCSLNIEWIYLNDEYTMIRCNSRFNVFDKNYNLISKEWFDNLYLDGGLLFVSKDRLANYLRLDGTLVFKVWFDGCDRRGNIFVLVNGRKKNLATLDGKIMLNEWVDDIELMDAEFPYAIKGGKRCYLAKDGSVCEFPPHMSFKNFDD
jgi:hypothetical protein